MHSWALLTAELLGNCWIDMIHTFRIAAGPAAVLVTMIPCYRKNLLVSTYQEPRI